MKRSKPTDEEIIANICKVIREEKKLWGQDLTDPRNYKRITSRMEFDMLLMLKIEKGKLKREPTIARIEYTRFTRKEIATLYAEIKLLKL